MARQGPARPGLAPQGKGNGSLRRPVSFVAAPLRSGQMKTGIAGRLDSLSRLGDDLPFRNGRGRCRIASPGGLRIVTLNHVETRFLQSA